MNVPIIYIGFAQAVFIALIIFLKRPLKIADVILGVWLVAIASIFSLNIGREVNDITQETWIYSLTISITYPAFLYLYAKYVTADYEKFQSKDYLHAIPLALTVLLIYLFRNPERKDFYFDLDHYEQLIWLRNLIGTSFILLLWIYCILALIRIFKYKRQVKNLYSFKSDRISLNWLMVVIISFILIYNLIIFTGFLVEVQLVSEEVYSITDAALLIYVYIVGIWGYRQNQLTSVNRPVVQIVKGEITKEPGTGRYQRSGLRDDQADGFLQRLIKFMNQSDAWKDNELSVAKLSLQTDIPKHHITQILNEKLGKNFYVFVNEYRVEHAKKLIKTHGYNSWSLVAIANECGFNSKTAFNNFFKKYTGVTPSEFRDN